MNSLLESLRPRHIHFELNRVLYGEILKVFSEKSSLWIDAVRHSLLYLSFAVSRISNMVPSRAARLLSISP